MFLKSLWQAFSFSQLFNEFKEHDTFIACGAESLIKSTQLSSDSASEDITPRNVENRARERVKFAVPTSNGNAAVNGDEGGTLTNGRWRNHKKGKKQDARNASNTQRGTYHNFILYSDIETWGKGLYFWHFEASKFLSNPSPNCFTIDVWNINCWRQQFISHLSYYFFYRILRHFTRLL